MKSIWHLWVLSKCPVSPLLAPFSAPSPVAQRNDRTVPGNLVQGMNWSTSTWSRSVLPWTLMGWPLLSSEAWKKTQPMMECFSNSKGLSLLPLSTQEAWVKLGQAHSLSLLPGTTPELMQDPGCPQQPCSCPSPQKTAPRLTGPCQNTPHLRSPKTISYCMSLIFSVLIVTITFRCFKVQVCRYWHTFPI